ncbi:hypothetical protein CC85DRAFT_282192 [Cutaneotrichosporon oleaginosum]|uniref:Uncharacterized protein n=1 Tax=Cutaneotrichosporon oleaginosum TaxID=879819 RepID=A0A0J0XYD4_9TREE|nr:uncharacterized protein CC85DRAFT_282192 [Cutaneotrichosporon oleaginosum]KLT46053.1 hypothetical protein CC85DRAFT_282192 [Cutaneotrichosporon oleaginosum]TXT06746.1 hypothetical protein COLE_06077 [Cutaneotrichosporon oleaginosum]
MRVLPATDSREGRDWQMASSRRYQARSSDIEDRYSVPTSSLIGLHVCLAWLAWLAWLVWPGDARGRRVGASWLPHGGR